MCLMGITGNIDAQGGQVLFNSPKIRTVGEFGGHKLLSREQAKKRLGGDRFRLAGNFSIINPKCVWDAIIDEEPYPVKMLFLISSNPVMTRANAKHVYEALEKVDFISVCDFFMTPTAELADVVLPASTWMEMDYIGDFWKRHGYILPRRKVMQVGECRPDHDMINDLANRLGLQEHWWDTFEEGLDHILEPMGKTWQEFKKMDYVRGELEYKKYEKKGFSTPTGKFELYSTLLKKWNCDPLPQYTEPPESPISTPELYKEYPYIMITGARQPGFFHTENRNLPWLRELHRDPIVEIHPEAAAKEGIAEGDWVVLETKRGKIRQRAKFFTGMAPNIVSAQHAWWFPEAKEGNHDWASSNINILTDNDYKNCDPAMGATPIRTLLVKIYREETTEEVQ